MKTPRYSAMFSGPLLAMICCVAIGCGKDEPAPPVEAIPADDAPGPAAATDPTDAPTETAEAPPAEGGWGNLTGTFVVDGSASEQQPLNITKDVEFCTQNPPLSEAVVVNEANGGLKNVVVYLYLSRGDDPPPVHESYAAGATEPVTLDNQWCRFDDHIVGVRTGQTLVVQNSDQVAHNTKIDALANAPINPILPAGAEVEKVFEREERLPIQVSCSIHPWMQGYVVVKDHPYFAITDENGHFEIKNLPTGDWSFQVWHETAGYMDEVEVDGEETEWSKGRVDVAISPGDNQLGEVQLAADLFE